MFKKLQWIALLTTLLGAAGWARADILELQFSGPDAGVSFNGGAISSVDLTVDLFADTADLTVGTGILGANEYENLTPYFSSTDLGLSDVAGTSLWSVEIGVPKPSSTFKHDWILLNNGTVFNGFLAITPAITSWNGTSSFGPAHAIDLGTGKLAITLSNGDTLSIGSFDNKPSFDGATFQALAVPEPGFAGLLGGILAASALVVRRRLFTHS